MFILQAPETICRTLGERIRKLRLARNLSQDDLAGMTGASLSSIRRLEAGGQGTLNLLARVALALQAAETLEPLFAQATHNIAQAEAALQAGGRQRARKPAAAPRGGGTA